MSIAQKELVQLPIFNASMQTMHPSVALIPASTATKIANAINQLGAPIPIVEQSEYVDMYIDFVYEYIHRLCRGDLADLNRHCDQF